MNTTRLSMKRCRRPNIPQNKADVFKDDQIRNWGVVESKGRLVSPSPTLAQSNATIVHSVPERKENAAPRGTWNALRHPRSMLNLLGSIRHTIQNKASRKGSLNGIFGPEHSSGDNREQEGFTQKFFDSFRNGRHSRKSSRAKVTRASVATINDDCGTCNHNSKYQVPSQTLGDVHSDSEIRVRDDDPLRRSDFSFDPLIEMLEAEIAQSPHAGKEDSASNVSRRPTPYMYQLEQPNAPDFRTVYYLDNCVDADRRADCENDWRDPASGLRHASPGSLKPVVRNTIRIVGTSGSPELGNAVAQGCGNPLKDTLKRDTKSNFRNRKVKSRMPTYDVSVDRLPRSRVRNVMSSGAMPMDWINDDKGRCGAKDVTASEDLREFSACIGGTIIRRKQAAQGTKSLKGKGRSLHQPAASSDLTDETFQRKIGPYGEGHIPQEVENDHPAKNIWVPLGMDADCGLSPINTGPAFSPAYGSNRETTGANFTFDDLPMPFGSIRLSTMESSMSPPRKKPCGPRTRLPRLEHVKTRSKASPAITVKSDSSSNITCGFCNQDLGGTEAMTSGMSPCDTIERDSTNVGCRACRSVPVFRSGTELD